MYYLDDFLFIFFLYIEIFIIFIQFNIVFEEFNFIKIIKKNLNDYIVIYFRFEFDSKMI